MSIDPKDHSYPFENLVFEGGGSKGHAYAGAIKVREYRYFACNGVPIVYMYPHFSHTQFVFKKDISVFYRFIRLFFTKIR